MLKVEVRVESVKKQKVWYHSGIKYVTGRDGCVDELSGVRKSVIARNVDGGDSGEDDGSSYRIYGLLSERRSRAPLLLFAHYLIRAAGSDMHASRLRARSRDSLVCRRLEGGERGLAWLMCRAQFNHSMATRARCRGRDGQTSGRSDHQLPREAARTLRRIKTSQKLPRITTLHWEQSTLVKLLNTAQQRPDLLSCLSPCRREHASRPMSLRRHIARSGEMMHTTPQTYHCRTVHTQPACHARLHWPTCSSFTLAAWQRRADQAREARSLSRSRS